MHNFEKKIVIFFIKRKSKNLDFLSGLLSNVIFLVFFWIAVASIILVFDFYTGIKISLCFVLLFVFYLVVIEGIFRLGFKKLSFGRQRPYKAYPEEIKVVGKKKSNSSFPSAHTANMTAASVILVSFYNFLWPFALAGVLLVGWSRIRNGMHYPSDILAGVVLGLLHGYLALWVVKLLF